jgi:hypothetical protein
MPFYIIIALNQNTLFKKNNFYTYSNYSVFFRVATGYYRIVVMFMNMQTKKLLHHKLYSAFIL